MKKSKPINWTTGEFGLCFLKNDEYIESSPSFLGVDDSFRFNLNDKITTSTLRYALIIGNRLDNLPDYVLRWCKHYGYKPMEVLS